MEKRDPFVWVSSKRLRTPYCPQTMTGTVRKAARAQSSRERTQSSRERENSFKNHKKNVSNSHIRWVRTATSADLFQKDEKPAFIDHHGNVIKGAIFPSDSQRTFETVNSLKNSRCTSRTSHTAGLTKQGGLNTGADNDFNHSKRRIDHHINESKLRNPRPKLSASFTTASQTTSSSSSVDEKGSTDRKHSTDIEKLRHPSRLMAVNVDCKQNGNQNLIPAIERAWSRPVSGRILYKHRRQSSEFSGMARSFTSMSSHRVPTSTSRGEAPTRSVSFDLSSPRSSSSDGVKENGIRSFWDDHESIVSEPSAFSSGLGHYNLVARPLSAAFNNLKVKRYLDERLRLMYMRRRAHSAHTRTMSTHHHEDSAKWTSQSGSDLSQGNDLTHESDSVVRPRARFRTLVCITIALRRLLLEIISNNFIKTPRSAVELQWMTVYAEQHDVSLVFNKHLYSRDRVTAHVPEWALIILHIPPEERTEQDCRRLHALLRGLKSFDKFTEEIQMALCKAFVLQRVQESRVVLKTGHVGISFYFIYSGSVFINIEDEAKDGKNFMRTVNIMTRGDSFGELALLQDIRRTATVSVREKCELLVVDKDVFASVCPKIFEKELAEKYAFISILDLFSTSYWSSDALHSLSMNAQIQEYKTNKVIVADSALEDWIYACMEGKCQVIRTLALDKPIQDGGGQRKRSDIVLSEEILQLLSSATGQQADGGETGGGDMKENLLSSLGLEYVETGQKVYQESSNANERKKSRLGVSDPTTLTALIQKEREQGKRDVVFLNVGVIEPGQIFDLPSLLEESRTSKTASSLMLVSGGAKIFRVKKAAFFDQASQQAIDNTRTLASKRKNLSEDSILESYKNKVAWEDFKADLVREVKRSHQLRYQPIHRSTSKYHDGNTSSLKKGAGRAFHKKSSKIISALQRSQTMSQKDVAAFSPSGEEENMGEPGEGSEGDEGRDLTDQTTRRRSHYFEDMKPVTQKEIVIMRRNPSSVRSTVKISKQSDIQPTTPGYSQRVKLDLSDWC